MAAVTNAPFRQLCREEGCAITVTEMVASEALVRGAGRTELRMERAPGERPLVVQLFGSNPDTMAEAARIAVDEAGADVVDVNMGCPVRKILGTGAGVMLMREPTRAAAIVRAMDRAVGSRAPVTAKIRAGWDDSHVNAVEVAQALEDAGAAAISIHARTKEQVHGGEARWEIIGDVKKAVRVPVLGNGGVKNASDAKRMREVSGCDAVMIGRGAHGNPWLFRKLADGLDYTPTREERFRTIRRHFDLYMEWAGEAIAVREMRKHLAWYLRGMPGSATLRAELQRMTTGAYVRAAIDAYEDALVHGEARPDARDFGGGTSSSEAAEK